MTASLPAIEFKIQGSLAEGNEVALFMHGWPDDASIWDLTLEKMKGDNITCVTYTLPFYGGDAVEARKTAARLGYESRGYNFDEIADAVAMAIREQLGPRPINVIAHDWGAYHGVLLQSRHPELVKRLVLLDVCPTESSSLKDIPAFIFIGLAYQYRQIVASMLARWGFSSMADAVGQVGVRWAKDVLIAGCDKKFQEEAASKMTAFCGEAGYPYVFYHYNYALRLLGLGGHLIGPAGVASCPTLFIYGSKKPFPFHSLAWAAGLKKRTDGSKVVGVPCGHWVQVEQADKVSEEIRGWLSSIIVTGKAADMKTVHSKL